MLCICLIEAGDKFTAMRFLLQPTVGGVGRLLDWWLLDLDLHLQARGPLPAPRAAVLPDDVGDSNHICGDFEERSEVLHQVFSEELVFSHGGQIEGEEQNRGGSDLHWSGSSHQDLQHLEVLVEEVGSISGIQFRDVLT